MTWRFVIHGKASEPYGEEGVRKLIDLNLLTPATHAWTSGMAAWKPASEIPDLARLFPAATPAPATEYPPLPTAAPAAPNDSPVPPPPPGASAGIWDDRARQFLYWCFRPRNGRPSKIRTYIDEKPGRAIPVALAVILGLFLSFALFVDAFSNASGQAGGGGGGGGAPGAGGQMGGGNTMENWYIARDAQRYNQNVIDDVYRNNRDSFDRQSETYRRANYDWYNNNND